MKFYDLIHKYGWDIMPIISNLGLDILASSNIYFVDSNATLASNVNDSEHGNSFDMPFATLNYAVSRCTDGGHDIILLAPGHAETIEDAGTVSGTVTDECTIDKTDLSIIGLGIGAQRPTFTLDTATDARLNITAGTINVTIKNIRIVSSFADVATGIITVANGTTIEDCYFSDGAVAEELVIGITVAAGVDNVTIKNCHFTTVPAGGCSSAIEFSGASDLCKIENNFVYGTYSAGALEWTTSAGVQNKIIDNIIVNVGALAIGLNASSTGVLARNMIGGTTSMAAALTGTDATVCLENYVTGDVDASGIILPAIDSE